MTDDQLHHYATRRAKSMTIDHAIALANSWQHKKHKDYKPFSHRTL